MKINAKIVELVKSNKIKFSKIGKVASFSTLSLIFAKTGSDVFVKSVKNKENQKILDRAGFTKQVIKEIKNSSVTENVQGICEMVLILEKELLETGYLSNSFILNTFEQYKHKYNIESDAGLQILKSFWRHGDKIKD